MKQFLFLLCLMVPLAEAQTTESSRALAREKFRESFFQKLDFYAPHSNDRAEDLVGTLQYQTLEAIESATLMAAKLPVAPWSDSYWPIYTGEIAHRYADKNYQAVSDWKANERYLLANLGLGPVNEMSPAEKYDLLVGDASFSLTKLMIGEGRGYYERDNQVETWMGLCHGWAPASFMMDRPQHSFTAMAADGRTKILFYPSDVKALATLLWANGRFSTRFVGGRCNSKKPPVDENGRPTDFDCLDNNPATWHLAVVNQIGANKASFVLDTNYDYEVWNQPIFSYRYEYINIATGKKANSLAEATVRLANYKDRFKNTRAPDAVSIVRIVMGIDFTLERDPVADEIDSPANDAYGNALYEYDLELSAEGKIVGGEWITRVHPDFLWAPAPGAVALSYGDLRLNQKNDQSKWGDGEVLPAAWREEARNSSLRKQPLQRIVKRLIEMANH